MNKKNLLKEENDETFIKWVEENKPLPSEKIDNEVSDFEIFYYKMKNNKDNYFNNETSAVETSFKENEENKHFDNNLPFRGDEKYTRIEAYEDYEFTHCIAYEMATRNENVKKLTTLLEELNSLSYDIITLFSSKMNFDEKYSNFLPFLNKLKNNINEVDYNNLSESILEINYKCLNELSPTQIQNIKERFIKIINKDSDCFISTIKQYQNSEIESLFLEYGENDLKELIKKIKNVNIIQLIMILKYSIENKLNFEYCVVNERKNIIPEGFEEVIDKDNNHEPCPDINDSIHNALFDSTYKQNYIHKKNSGYIAYQGISKEDNNFTINKVIPNFNQPLRMFNTMDISINPSLPLNDILSFVKKIKKDYDENNSFKSFFELTEEELNLQNNKTTIDNKISFTKTKWADMFYIYDYFQFYLKNKMKINKDKNENGRANREDDFTTIAKEISLQLSFYHILNQKELLDFSESANNDNYLSKYNKYETELLFEIIERIKTNKEYEKYIKLRKNTKEKKIDFYITANHIKVDYYPKIKKLIEGEKPEYLKLIIGKNHISNSFFSNKK